MGLQVCLEDFERPCWALRQNIPSSQHLLLPLPSPAAQVVNSRSNLKSFPPLVTCPSLPPSHPVAPFQPL